MFYEANEPSSACRPGRDSQVETSTPPIRSDNDTMSPGDREVKAGHATPAILYRPGLGKDVASTSCLWGRIQMPRCVPNKAIPDSTLRGRGYG